MIPELGQLCLVFAFLLSTLQACVPLLQKIAEPHGVMGLTRPLATLVFLMIASAFSALMLSYAHSDFTVLAVVENSNLAMPMLYKIVSTWGNHEGSMLLWMLVLAASGFLVAFLRTPDALLKATTLSVLGLISAGFLAFILFTSNPFIRVFPAPANGEDLNPILQDIGLAFHPPLLYAGYVGFGIVFAYAVAGMLLGKLDSAWARQVQPWIYLPWAALTLGIGAGSWWAYRTLGWGGFWFWDPVENVSLLPWLAGTALLHSNLVLEKRGQLARWVALLAILTFSMSLIGTFVVRSGLITSVHSFAADPARGMFILSYIVCISGGALTLFSFCTIKPTPSIALNSRSGMILINNLFLVTATFTVLLAILYPLGLQLIDAPGVSVGEGYFNRTVLPLLAPLLLLAALAPLVAWDRATRAQYIAQATAAIPAILAAGFLVLLIRAPHMALTFAGLSLAGILLFSTARYGMRQHRLGHLVLSPAGLRHWATVAAHGGVAVFVAGLVFVSVFKQSYDASLDGNKPITLGPYTLRIIQAERVAEHNYISRRATFMLSEGDHMITTLSPELRYFPARHMQTSIVALASSPRRDFYLVLGETSPAESGKKEKANPLGIRLYVTPGQQLVWCGFVLAAFGGALALLATFWRNSISKSTP